MENPTHSFTAMNHVHQLVSEVLIKSEAVMSWSLQKKNSAFFVTFILSKGSFTYHLGFIPIYSVLNKLSEYIYFYILKTLLHAILLLVFKIDESLQCILNATLELN